MRQPNPKFKRYWYAGVTAFLVIAAALVLNLIFNHLGQIGSVLQVVNSAMKPVYIGLIIAFLLSPIVNKSDQYIFGPLMHKLIKKEQTAQNVTRGLSVAAVTILALVIIFGLFMMVVPAVISSIRQLGNSMPTYYHNLLDFGDRLFKSYPSAAEYFNSLSTSIYTKLSDWLWNDVLPNSNKMLTFLTGKVMLAVGVVMDVIIGIIVSIYFMARKENFCAQAKKLLYAIFPKKWSDSVLSVLGETHTVFAKFISGILIDAMIVGILTFIVMSIAGMPYTVLVSVIIGVTNIIPYFGPYIGTIPSATLILIANPMKGILFIVLIIILQQIDGNIINPKILGDSTGLKSFWILFSILLFGSLFGLPGMICAVPVFAMIYRWIKRFSERRLEKKGLAVDTSEYRTEPIQKEKKVIEKKK